MLSLIGIGLHDEKDITMKGLEKVRSAEYVYLEEYTSKLQCTVRDLETFYGRSVTVVGREFVEDGNVLLSQAGYQQIALLIAGDVFAATTHIALLAEAKKKGVDVEVIHNSSVLTAVGITGLELYKFGRVTSMPFHESVTPIDVIKKNYPLHTLCLLDLDPEKNLFMDACEAIATLVKNGLDENTKVVVCAQLGSPHPTIIYTEAKNVKLLEKYPQCLIIPGALHFMEEDFLKQYA